MGDSNETTLYVAYGSNCNISQMKKRCSGSSIYGVGYILDYQLRFKGVATITPRKRYKVPVVVWNVTDKDIIELDVYEGIKNNLYRKEQILVLLETGETVEAMVYILNRECTDFEPSQFYYFIILQGYLENNLPLRYLSSAFEKAYASQKLHKPKFIQDERIINKGYFSYSDNRNKK